MAAKRVGSGGTLLADFIGTDAELAGVTTTTLAVGCTYYAYDTKASYIWHGTAWVAL